MRQQGEQQHRIFGSILVITALALLMQITHAYATGKTARERHPVITMNETGADMRLPAPTRYAVVLYRNGQIRRLYTQKDVFVHPVDQTRSFTILRVEPGAVTLRENPSGRTQVRQSGTAIPNLPGLLLAETVMLKQLRYLYKVVERFTPGDPVLVSLDGSMAVLEKEVLRPATTDHPPDGALGVDGKNLSPALSRLVRVKEVDVNR
ncbi:MAG: hypothetical protein C4293_03550, partial [Nitrospiraceae bacterium]